MAIDYLETIRQLQVKADDESSRLGALAKEYGRLLDIETTGVVEGLTVTATQRTKLAQRKAAIETAVAAAAGPNVVKARKLPDAV